jgi:uncharacterized protein (TIGR00369 family)
MNSQDLLQHPLIQKYIQSNHFGRHLQMNFIIPEPGRLEYHLKIAEIHLATPHAAHGGVLAALADGAQGVCALSMVCSENKVVSTLQLNIQFMAGPALHDEITAFAKVLKPGKNIVFTECSIIRNKDQKLLAFSTATFNAYPAEKAGY